MNSGFDRPRPVLPRHQPFLVQPGPKAAFFEGTVKLPGEREILLDVGDEYTRLVLRHEAKAMLASRRQCAQAIDVYRFAAFQRFTEHPRDPQSEGCASPRVAHSNALRAFGALMR